AGFDWKILGPDFDHGWLDYVAWQADEDAYNAAGQKCSAQSALFVHDNWADALLPKLGELAARRSLDDLTIGPVLTWNNEQIRAHIDAARRTGLPLIVHTRDADELTIETLEQAMAERPFNGVVHCYSSGPRLADVAIELGLYLGIGGILTFKRSEELRQAVRRLPLERLLLETDAPYLAPEPFRGKRNEPALVGHVAARLAQLKEVPAEDIARATTDNFFRLFAKARPPAT
ncbi:MAG: TatD family hydrolase, partial [Geminicoccaceae bacterium]|nr:TatD family hydrolase [Geminicoccaceae bacterium]